MNPRFWLVGAFLFVVLLGAIKPESLWIDEGDTACYAIQPDFHAWKTHLLTDTNADCQFPLYMVLVWLWAKLFGSGEYALRALNAVFAMLAIFAFAVMGRQLKLRWLWAMLLVQPFFWFYLNEARPYMLQIASGSVLLAGLVLLCEGGRKSLGWGLFFVGTILLYYSTLVSFVTLGAFFTAVLYLIWRKQLTLPPRWVAFTALLGLILAPGAIYYIQTVLRGAGGARIWSVSPLNFAWIYYEMTGGVGLGPPVWRIREVAREVIQSGISIGGVLPFVLPAVLGASVATVMVSYFLRIRNPSRREFSAFLLLFVFLTTIAAFAILSVLLHKAFWARHLAPIFPVYALLLYVSLRDLWKRDHPRLLLSRALAAFAWAILLASSIALLFSGVHAKDDYRSAARAALTELRKGGEVWWAGSWHCGAYYGLPIADGASTSPRLKLFQSPVQEVLTGTEIPNLILISRQDIYDEKNTLIAFAEKNGFARSSHPIHLISVWEKSGK